MTIRKILGHIILTPVYAGFILNLLVSFILHHTIGRLFEWAADQVKKEGIKVIKAKGGANDAKV